MSDRPKIVVLIGSSRFKDEFHRQGALLEKQGILALMMSFFEHADGVPVSPEEREVLRRVDRARIDMADEVLVINCKRHWCPRCNQWKDRPHYDWPATGGMGYDVCPRVHCYTRTERRPYIGEDTSIEIAYATNRGKPITYLEEPTT